MMNIYKDLGVSAWRFLVESFLSHTPCTFFLSKNTHPLEYFYISGPDPNKHMHRYLDHVYQSTVKYYYYHSFNIIENKTEIPEVLCTKICNIYQIGLLVVPT